LVNMKILYIEDDKSFQYIVRKKFGDMNIVVDCVGTLTQAIFKLEAEKYDFVLVDFFLESPFDGGDIIETLIIKHIPYLIYSGSVDEIVSREPRLPKSVSFDMLYEKVMAVYDAYINKEPKNVQTA